MDEPPELAGRLDTVRQFWSMRKVLRFFTGKYGRTAAEFAADLHDPTLRYLVENLFLPEAPLWFLFMVLGLLASGDMGLLTTGCEGFVRPIERRYHDLGGEITYGATVEKILVSGGKAVGVKLVSGEEVSADAVISAADGYSTLFGMLDGRYGDDALRALIGTGKLMKPWVMISFGVARDVPGRAALHHVPLSPSRSRSGPSGWRAWACASSTTCPTFAPAGKTVIQPAFETEWTYWNDLRAADRDRYEAEKERVAAEVLSRLEAHYPGLSTQVEMTDVATPYTTWRYTLNWQGAYEGWLPTGSQLMTALSRTPPGWRISSWPGSG